MKKRHAPLTIRKADPLRLRDEIASAEAHVADAEAQLTRARAALAALHRYDSVFIGSVSTPHTQRTITTKRS